jgi:hypothetical protein
VHISVIPAAVYAELDDGAVILNVNSGIYYGLDSVGSRIWSLVSGGSTPDAIVDQLETEYAEDRARLQADVTELLQTLEAKGLVQISAN